jgi:hypothetical protein
MGLAFPQSTRHKEAAPYETGSAATFKHKAVSMGKYKQWLHHQEVGARLRDEIAAHEAERERVLKLAPTKETSLPDLSNPIIAALLGQASLLKAPEQVKAEIGSNGTTSTATTKGEIATGINTVRAEVAAEPTAASKVATQATNQKAREEAQAQPEESAAAKPAATTKPKAAAISTKTSGEKQATSPSPAATPAVPEPSGQLDTIDPLLEQLLAQAENAPADPLEALNLLASQGPNLTRGEAPQPAPSLPAAPLTASPGQSALNALLNESRPTAEPQKPAGEPASAPVAVGVEVIASAGASVHTEVTARAEKGRSDTDELVAARPTEGYTEPRLIVPQWLRSMELSQDDQEGDKTGDTVEETDEKQRFSVSLPFENEEDMRLHESVERWWQRWRQQS